MSNETPTSSPPPTPRVSPIPEAKQYFRGKNTPRQISELAEPPPWRRFTPESVQARGANYFASAEEVTAVNAALYLRRPLLITGRPGTGKTSLAFAVQQELMLDDVFVWPITSRTTLQHGLYHYDAIARLQDVSLAEASARLAALSVPAGGPKPAQASAPPASVDIGKYLRLGPLGAALRCSKKNRPSVLLIDEIDKSDIDLPNDLLHVFEEGQFEIPELARLPDEPQFRSVAVGLPRGDQRVAVERGRIVCEEFPIVFLTSNGEREFPPAFLRRCLRLDIPDPDAPALAEIVRKRLGVDPKSNTTINDLINDFIKSREGGQQLATDQLLNAVRLLTQGVLKKDDLELKKYVVRDLSDTR